MHGHTVKVQFIHTHLISGILCRGIFLLAKKNESGCICAYIHTFPHDTIVHRSLYPPPLVKMNGYHESSSSSSSLPMSLAEYARYGRQMILPSMGLEGQLKLRQAKVLVVGGGGLGCPAVQYLAAAGVGKISVVDHDHVEKSNLQRQILHTDERVGMNKAVSISIAAKIINPHIEVIPIQKSFSVENAIDLVQSHDIVLDCTDNVLTRYLISDAAVRCQRQVVSGAAQGFDGQLVVLHKDLRVGASASGLSSSTSQSNVPRGPCYRCLFPRAPKPEEVTDCEDGGVLGTITGLVGTMQAFETIKLLIGLGDDAEDDRGNPIVGMTLVSPLNFPPFKTVKLRPRRIKICRACGDKTQMEEELVNEMISEDLSRENYIAFCGLNSKKSLKGFDEMNAMDFAKALQQNHSNQSVIDVRPNVEYQIAHLPSTKSIPFRQIDSDPLKWYKFILQSRSDPNHDQDNNVYILCRRGNDSRLACHALSAAAEEANSGSQISNIRFINVTGGLRAWSNTVDQNFPVY